MRFLIVRLGSLGDIINALAVLPFIRENYPDAFIDWLVDERFADIVKGQKDLHEVFTVSLKDPRISPMKKIRSLFHVARHMGPYDRIIDMQGLMKSAFLARLIGKNVVGFDARSVKEFPASFFYRTRVRISFNEHILTRNFYLTSQALNLPWNPEVMSRKKPYLDYVSCRDFSEFLSKEKKNILAVIGGSWPSKIYPEELLAQVIGLLRQNVLLLWHGEEERKRAETIIHRTPYARMLPEMNLDDVKALIDRVDIVLGNDTGPIHMAWALNKPSVTILGCTSITRIAVGEKQKAVTSGACVNPSGIDRNDFSIREIPPAKIAEAVESLYEEVGSNSSIQPPPKT